MKASEQIAVRPESTCLELLEHCNGYYECPKDAQKRRLGPLVGYAGRYTAADGSQKQFVGDVYANFAAAERFTHVMDHYAQLWENAHHHVLYNQARVEVFCGAPIGGYAFCEALARRCDRKSIKAEKKVIAVATSTSREESHLVFGRHTVMPNERVVIVEDVCNNFSTTSQLVRLITETGGVVVGIACLLNRSLDVGDMYTPSEFGHLHLPVLSLVQKPIMEYRQGNPAVFNDVVRGNVVWKPKDEWTRLCGRS